MDNNIDFIVTWVNGGDPDWLKKKNKYLPVNESNENMNSESRYRDFDIFKFWFRAVEKFAPWVHKIYLITDNQVPDWLDTRNSKLTVIDHRDIMDADWLPTFNSNAIELNAYKIKNLSEKFVLFNDDMILNNYVDKVDFFDENYPKDIYVESPIMATKGSVDHIMVNNVEIINEFFEKKNFYKKNLTKVFNPKIGIKLLRTLALLPSSKFAGFWNSHLPISYNKTTFETVWSNCEEKLVATSKNKFRTAYDVSHWLMRYWQLASGNYHLQNNIGKVYDLSSQNIDEVVTQLQRSHSKIICLNDNDELDDYLMIKEKLVVALSDKFVDKSEFEL